MKTVFLFLFFTLISRSFVECNSGFSFEETKEGVMLTENGKSVFFYQKKNKSPDGKHFFSNYLHPLYDLNGDTLTKEFPPDHKHHRGIFYAWHQHYIGSENIGDGWLMDGITYNVKEVKTSVNPGNAKLNITAMWTSTKWNNSKPYIEEHTTITVFPADKNCRIIDFTIELRALTRGVSIGGSNDEKGYGGFSCRIKMPDGLTFTSKKGKVKPQRLQVEAGRWMDFSAPFGSDDEVSGVTLICDKTNPGYPQAWILRQKNSMQNVVYPGRERVEIPIDKPLVLKYKMIIHKGDVRAVEELINSGFE